MIAITTSNSTRVKPSGGRRLPYRRIASGGVCGFMEVFLTIEEEMGCPGRARSTFIVPKMAINSSPLTRFQGAARAAGRTSLAADNGA